MYSMIIVVIAIALAVLLAIATLYYGGNAFNRDSVRLVAHTLVNQSGQIAAARQLARAEGRPLPEGSVVQMPTDLLATMPVPPKGAYETGTPSAQDWEYYLTTSKEHFGLSLKLNQKTCMELNRSQGFIGIPAAWDGTSRMQCFGPTPEGSYTFLYELPTATPAERADAVDKAVNDAKPDAPTARPGYPRLCPDGTTIDTGLCAGTGTGPETPPPTEEQPGGKADGFWLVTAQVHPYGPRLDSEGFSKNCPTGYVDPTGADATPAPSLPGDPLNVDSVIEMEWQLAPEYDSSFTRPLERKWCIPANEIDVADGVAFPDTNQGGDVVDIVNVASPSAEGVDAATWTNSYVRNVVISANGVTWTMAAIGFTAETENSHNGDMLALEGRKIGIGKTTGASHTYFVNSPTVTSNGITYQNQSGRITFSPAPPPCVPPTPNIPLNGGEIIDIGIAGYTSVMLKRDGSVWMSGAGWDYDFGNCSAKDRHVWTRVATGVAALSNGTTGKTLMIKHDGSVWRSSPDSPIHIKVYDGPTKQAEQVGNDGIAILRPDGTLWYNGSNWQAQAGNGTTEPTEGFVQVDSNVASISSSSMNVFYIKTDGSLWATGESNNYHLGGSYPRSTSGWFSTPGMRPLKLADGVSQVHGSSYATFYVKTDGSVYAAGNDIFRCGIFGRTPTVNVHTTFTRVADYLGPVKRVHFSGSSVWLQTMTGDLYAGGCNDHGSFGDGTTNKRTTYTKVATAPKVFYGDDIAFIVDTADTLWIAGYNDEGLFGNGTTTGSTVFIPVQY